MANLSNEEINKIRNSVNIVDIIGSNINLEKKGKNYFGLCPFHDDHSPSLSVSEEKQIYTCFVCGASGNVFSFLKDYENITFMEAVSKIANISGVDLPKNIVVAKKYNLEYKIYDFAVKFYKNNLKSKEGKLAVEYLAKRNISQDIIDEFDIGVSLNNNNLSKILLEKKYDEKMIVDLGLANNGDGIYDIFRNRIMFPIHNHNGDPIGFSGRIYNNEVDSKYINTKETYIFKKGEVLFNFHRAISEAKKKKEIIICEGQMDAIRIYSSGIKNVIATMGTALTKHHVDLIKKLNSTVILNMDSDKAGENAALTNGDLLAKAGINVNVIKLDGAKDPDEYIQKYGVDNYKNAISHAISLFDFKLNYLKSNKNLDNADDLAKYINSVIKELNEIDDEVLKTITINKLSEKYNIDKNIILSKIIDKKNVIVNRKIPSIQKYNQNIKAVRELLYYMMNNVKYAKKFMKELNYIPDETYFDIEKDIQAYIILNSTINLADFITYEQGKDKEYLIREIITSHNNNIEICDEEFDIYLDIIKKWIKTDKISKFKEEIKKTTDINRKKELMEIITKIKKGSE